MAKPKILLLDVETAPGTAYVWSLWDKFIPLERMIEPGRIICAAWKWYGKKDMYFFAEWQDRNQMMDSLRVAIEEADAVVTYNGDKFDLPRITGELVRDGWEPLGPITSIDLYKQVKKLGYFSSKLAYVAPFLEIGNKTKHAGFDLWRRVLNGDATAQATMERYNKQDVRLLGRLYKYLRPYMANHPHLKVDAKKESCPNCGSTHIQKRGYRRTRTMKIERLNCQTCGAWSSGAKQRIQ